MVDKHREVDKQKILEYILKNEARHIERYGFPRAYARRDIAEKFRISRHTAARKLDELVMEGKLYRVYEFVYFPIWYYYPYYYRTQVAVIVYAREPGTKTPDPIAEVRVTCVSMEPGKYDPDQLEKAVLHTLVLLNPKSYWKEKIDLGELLVEYTAREVDEKIEADEVADSLPCFWRVGYCERMAVFYRSRRESKLRYIYDEWWLDIRNWDKRVQDTLDRVSTAMYGKPFRELSSEEKRNVLDTHEVREVLIPTTGDYLYPEEWTSKLIMKLGEWRTIFTETGSGKTHFLAYPGSVSIADLEIEAVKTCRVNTVFSNVLGKLVRVK